MTSDANATAKSLKAFGSIGANSGKLPHGELASRVSSILAPDAVASMEKRSASISIPQKTEPAAGGDRGRSPGGRRKKDSPAIDVKNPTYSDDIIKTTNEMAHEVSSILGANVLGALKASCDERKEHEKHQAETPRKKSPPPPASVKNSSLLTPEMVAAMEAMKSAKTQPKDGVAPQTKKQAFSDDDAGDKEVEEESDEEGRLGSKGRVRRNKSGDRPSNSGKSQARSASGSGSPKRTPSRANSGEDAHHHHHRRRKKKPHGPGAKRSSPANSNHAHDFDNHADDVGIDLEDGLPGDLDEFEIDESEKAGGSRKASASRNGRPAKASDQRRGRAPRKVDSVGGAAPGRRGRNGRRGGGTRLGNIKKNQVAQMTEVDQTKQFREEDVIYQSESEQEPEEEPHSEASQSSEDGLLEDFADAATATASMVAKHVGDVAADAGGAIFGALGTAASLTASTAAYTANTVAAGANDAAMSLRGVTLRQQQDDYSDDEDEGPMPASTGSAAPSWGFSGGGIAPQIK